MEKHLTHNFDQAVWCLSDARSGLNYFSNMFLFPVPQFSSIIIKTVERIAVCFWENDNEIACFLTGNVVSRCQSGDKYAMGKRKLELVKS